MEKIMENKKEVNFIEPKDIKNHLEALNLKYKEINFNNKRCCCNFIDESKPVVLNVFIGEEYCNEFVKQQSNRDNYRKVFRGDINEIMSDSNFNGLFLWWKQDGVEINVIIVKNWNNKLTLAHEFKHAQQYNKCRKTIFYFRKRSRLKAMRWLYNSDSFPLGYTLSLREIYANYYALKYAKNKNLDYSRSKEALKKSGILYIIFIAFIAFIV